MTEAQAPPTVAEFLKDDPRQVWAVRTDGTPVFLPEGKALELRAEVKASWRCPTPGCDGPLTTVSGDRRHHWRHDGPTPHSTSGESQNHLQAKAMIAYWAARQAPHADIVEEQATEKDPATSRYRRADVMVNWPDGSRLAFEVEYKPYTPADWALKQGDYDNHPEGPVNCVWLLGHTKIRLTKTGVGLAQVPGTEMVNIPLLGKKIIAAGQTLLFVNPLMRTIGTVVSRYPDEDGLARAAAVDEARLILDPLEDCTLDPQRGLVTPTMRAVDEADQRRAVRRANAATRARIAQEQAVARREQAEARRERIEVLKREQLAVWEASILRNTFIQRWGKVPDHIARDTDTSYGVWAHPAHWHGVIYEELLHDRKPQQPFTWPDITRALAKHGIRQHTYDPKARFKALIAFLERLERARLLAIHRDHKGHVHRLVPSGYNIEDLPRLEREKAEAQRRAAEERNARDRAERERLAGIRAEEERLLASTREARDAQRAQQAEEWETSEVRAAVVAIFGAVPPAIEWAGGENRDAIAVHGACWHAHIYLTLIHEKERGFEFTANDALTVLSAQGITFPAGADAAAHAISSYLFNLGQRGILRRLRDEEADLPDVIQTVTAHL